MPRYISFLRAVNVGGRIVRMEYLRELLASLKFKNVETFIASGNAIFEAPEKNAVTLEARIEKCLAAALKYEIEVFIRTPGELAVALDNMPFADPGVSLHGGFLKSVPTSACEYKLLQLATTTDRFHLRGREFWWRAATRMSDSKITGQSLERALGMRTTMRNITTLRKLAAKYPAVV
ncbi:MAG: DUF1697 domain-containing protein [Gemmatimonadaceae bacterium]